MFKNGNFSKDLDAFKFASKDDLAAYREEFGVEYDAGWDALTSDFLF